MSIEKHNEFWRIVIGGCVTITTEIRLLAEMIGKKMKS